jgi:hypothetical protein
MVIVYQLIVLFVLTIAIWLTVDEEDRYLQATAALVAIPLALRVLMIK